MFWKNFSAVFTRELRRLSSRPIYLFSMVVSMAILTLFFVTLLDEGVPQKLPVAIVDHDGSSISRRFVRELNATQVVEVIHTVGTYTEARQMMQEGYIYGFIEIPQDFYADLLAFRRPHISCYINAAYNLAGSQTLKQFTTLANLASGAYQREILRAKGLDDEKIMNLIQPISIDTHPIGNPWSNYSFYLLSTILPGILGIVVIMMSVFSFGRELKDRTARDVLMLAGNDMGTLYLGKMLPYTIICTIVGVLINGVLYEYLHFPINGHFWFMALGEFLMVLAMQCMGIALITTLPVLRIAVSVGALYSTLGFSLSGFTFPVAGMYPVIQGASALFPLRHYYMMQVHSSLLDLSPSASWIQVCALLAFLFIPFACTKRLKGAFTDMDYPVK